MMTERIEIGKLFQKKDVAEVDEIMYLKYKIKFILLAKMYICMYSIIWNDYMHYTLCVY